MKKKFLVCVFCMALALTACNSETPDVVEDTQVVSSKENTDKDDSAKAEKETVTVISKMSSYDINNSGMGTVTINYKYDEAGKMIESVQKTKAMTLTTKHEHSEDGKTVKATVVDENGNVVGASEQNYDEKGNFTAISYDGNGELIATTNYEFDEKGNQIKKIYSAGEYSLENTYENEYVNEKLEKQVEYTEGQISSSLEYEYNEEGNLSKTTQYNAEGEVSVYSIYEYDKNGNLSNVRRYTPENELVQEMEYITIEREV